MIEQALNWLLNTFFQKYIENSESHEEKFRLGILSGNFIFQNLRFKSTILDDVSLAIKLKVCTIGQIKIEVPWTRLGSAPIVLALEDIVVVLQPKYEVDAPDVLKHDRRRKEARVKSLISTFFKDNTSSDDARDMKATNSNKQSGNGNEVSSGAPAYSLLGNMYSYALTWVKQSLSRVLDSIRVEVRTVHVRYEDQVSTTPGLAIGCMIQSLQLRPTENEVENQEVKNHESDPTYRDATTSDGTASSSTDEKFYVYKKTLSVSQVSSYAHPLAGLDRQNYTCGLGYCASLSRSDIESWMSHFVGQPSEAIRTHYLLQPLDISVAVTAKHWEPSHVPSQSSKQRVEAQVTARVAPVELGINELQLRGITACTTSLSNVQGVLQLTRFRPTVPVMGNASAWWRYAIFAVRAQVRRCLPTFTLWSLNQHRKAKAAYRRLWRIMSANKTEYEVYVKQRNIAPSELLFDMDSLCESVLKEFDEDDDEFSAEACAMLLRMETALSAEQVAYFRLSEDPRLSEHLLRRESKQAVNEQSDPSFSSSSWWGGNKQQTHALGESNKQSFSKSTDFEGSSRFDIALSSEIKLSKISVSLLQRDSDTHDERDISDLFDDRPELAMSQKYRPDVVLEVGDMCVTANGSNSDWTGSVAVSSLSAYSLVTGSTGGTVSADFLTGLFQHSQQHSHKQYIVSPSYYTDSTRSGSASSSSNSSHSEPLILVTFSSSRSSPTALTRVNVAVEVGSLQVNHVLCASKHDWVQRVTRSFRGPARSQYIATVPHWTSPTACTARRPVLLHNPVTDEIIPLSHRTRLSLLSKQRAIVSATISVRQATICLVNPNCNQLVALTIAQIEFSTQQSALDVNKDALVESPSSGLSVQSQSNHKNTKMQNVRQVSNDDDKFYNTFHLKVTSIKLDLASLDTQSTTPLLEPVDIFVDLSLCALTEDRSLSRAKLVVDVPKVCFRLSNTKLASLIRILTSYQDSPRKTSAVAPSELVPVRVSTPVAEVDNDITLETAHANDVDEDEFFDAEPGDDTLSLRASTHSLFFDTEGHSSNTVVVPQSTEDLKGAIKAAEEAQTRAQTDLLELFHQAEEVTGTPTDIEQSVRHATETLHHCRTELKRLKQLFIEAELAQFNLESISGVSPQGIDDDLGVFFDAEDADKVSESKLLVLQLLERHQIAKERFIKLCSISPCKYHNSKYTPDGKLLKLAFNLSELRILTELPPLLMQPHPDGSSSTSCLELVLSNLTVDLDQGKKSLHLATTLQEMLVIYPTVHEPKLGSVYSAFYDSSLKVTVLSFRPSDDGPLFAQSIGGAITPRIAAGTSTASARVSDTALECRVQVLVDGTSHITVAMGALSITVNDRVIAHVLTLASSLITTASSVAINKTSVIQTATSQSAESASPSRTKSQRSLTIPNTKVELSLRSVSVVASQWNFDQSSECELASLVINKIALGISRVKSETRISTQVNEINITHYLQNCMNTQRDRQLCALNTRRSRDSKGFVDVSVVVIDSEESSNMTQLSSPPAVAVTVAISAVDVRVCPNEWMRIAAVFTGPSLRSATDGLQRSVASMNELSKKGHSKPRKATTSPLVPTNNLRPELHKVASALTVAQIHTEVNVGAVSVVLVLLPDSFALDKGVEDSFSTGFDSIQVAMTVGPHNGEDSAVAEVSIKGLHVRLVQYELLLPFDVGFDTKLSTNIPVNMSVDSRRFDLSTNVRLSPVELFVDEQTIRLVSHHIKRLQAGISVSRAPTSRSTTARARRITTNPTHRGISGPAITAGSCASGMETRDMKLSALQAMFKSIHMSLSLQLDAVNFHSRRNTPASRRPQPVVQLPVTHASLSVRGIHLYFQSGSAAPEGALLVAGARVTAVHVAIEEKDSQTRDVFVTQTESPLVEMSCSYLSDQNAVSLNATFQGARAVVDILALASFAERVKDGMNMFKTPPTPPSMPDDTNAADTLSSLLDSMDDDPQVPTHSESQNNIEMMPLYFPLSDRKVTDNVLNATGNKSRIQYTFSDSAFYLPLGLEKIILSIQFHSNIVQVLIEPDKGQFVQLALDLTVNNAVESVDWHSMLDRANSHESSRLWSRLENAVMRSELAVQTLSVSLHTLDELKYVLSPVTGSITHTFTIAADFVQDNDSGGEEQAELGALSGIMFSSADNAETLPRIRLLQRVEVAIAPVHVNVFSDPTPWVTLARTCSRFLQGLSPTGPRSKTPVKVRPNSTQSATRNVIVKTATPQIHSDDSEQRTKKVEFTHFNWLANSPSVVDTYASVELQCLRVTLVQDKLNPPTAVARFTVYGLRGRLSLIAIQSNTSVSRPSQKPTAFLDCCVDVAISAEFYDKDAHRWDELIRQFSITVEAQQCLVNDAVKGHNDTSTSVLSWHESSASVSLKSNIDVLESPNTSFQVAPPRRQCYDLIPLQHLFSGKLESATQLQVSVPDGVSITARMVHLQQLLETVQELQRAPNELTSAFAGYQLALENVSGVSIQYCVTHPSSRTSNNPTDLPVGEVVNLGLPSERVGRNESKGTCFDASLHSFPTQLRLYVGPDCFTVALNRKEIGKPVVPLRDGLVAELNCELHCIKVTVRSDILITNDTSHMLFIGESQCRSNATLSLPVSASGREVDMCFDSTENPVARVPILDAEQFVPLFESAYEGASSSGDKFQLTTHRAGDKLQLAYNHWLGSRLTNLDLVHLNVGIVLSKRKGEKLISTTLRVSPPLRFTNAMACSIELSVGRHRSSMNIRGNAQAKNGMKVENTLVIESGQTVDVYAFSPMETVEIRVRFHTGPGSIGFQRRWSTPVSLTASDPTGSGRRYMKTQTSFIEDSNDAELAVTLETEETAGCRFVTVFVPFWVANASLLPELQLCHDERMQSDVCTQNIALNGVDQLPADHPSLITPKPQPQTARKLSMSSEQMLGSPKGRSTKLPSIPSAPRLAESTIEQSASSSTGSSYKWLMHCGYTNSETETCYLRARTSPASSWSERHVSAESATSGRAPCQPLALVRAGRIAHIIATAVSLPDVFKRTKCIIIADAYTIRNSLRCAIDVDTGSHGSECIIRVQPGQVVNLSWTTATASRTMRFKLALSTDWFWSSALSLSKSDSRPVRFVNTVSSQSACACVRVDTKSVSAHVTVSEWSAQDCPYIIENLSQHTVMYRQAGSSYPALPLPPRSGALYAWDEPSGSPSLELSLKRNFSHQTALIGCYRFDLDNATSAYSELSEFHVCVVKEGPFHVLKILPISSANLSSLAIVSDIFAPFVQPTPEASSQKQVQVAVSLPNISFNIIGLSTNPLLRLTALGGEVALSSAGQKQTLSVKVGSMLLQRFSTDSSHAVSVVESIGVDPFLAVSVQKVQHRRAGASFKPVSSHLVSGSAQPVAVNLEGDFLFDLVTTAVKLSRTLRPLVAQFSAAAMKVPLDYRTIVTKILKHQLPHSRPASGSSGSVYFDSVVMSKLKVHLSVDPAITTPSSGVLHSAASVTASLLSSLTKITGLELALPDLRMENRRFNSGAHVATLISKHYATEAVSIGSRVLGSLRSTKAPAEILQLVGTGMWDLLVSPFTASRKSSSPFSFAGSVATGSSSFVRNTLAALLLTLRLVIDCTDMFVRVVGEFPGDTESTPSVALTTLSKRERVLKSRNESNTKSILHLFRRHYIGAILNPFHISLCAAHRAANALVSSLVARPGTARSEGQTLAVVPQTNETRLRLTVAPNSFPHRGASQLQELLLPHESIVWRITHRTQVVAVTQRRILVALMPASGLYLLQWACDLGSILSLSVIANLASMHAFVDFSIISDSDLQVIPQARSASRTAWTEIVRGAIDSEGSEINQAAPIVGSQSALFYPLSRSTEENHIIVSPSRGGSLESTATSDTYFVVNNTTRSFARKLVGEPSLEISYSRTDGESQDNNNNCQLDTHTVQFPSHEAMLDALVAVLMQRPELLDPPLVRYLTQCGVRQYSDAP